MARWSVQKIEIGYVSLNEDGTPYQPELSAGHKKRKKPVTVFKEKRRAEGYSPCGVAKVVFMEIPVEKTLDKR